MVLPSLLVAKETKARVLNLRDGAHSLTYLPLTIGGLLVYVFFGMDFMSQVPILGWSWLGYNIALGPYAESGAVGILPFVPMLLYMLIHVNYFEEMCFRKRVRLVVIWAFLHVAIRVAVHVAMVLLPVGFLCRHLFLTRGINHAYALHFMTNVGVVSVAIGGFYLLT